MAGRSVLVRTLTVFNGNYGGTVQAYALQRTIRELGHRVVTDTSMPVKGLSRVKRAIRPMVVSGLPARWVPARGAAPRVNQHISRFAREHMDLVDLYRGRATPDPSLVGEFDTFVVGSDQVWRRAYADVESFLFDFIDHTDATLLSYAASFGSDDVSDWSPALIQSTRRLAARFEALSVREHDAVALVNQLWGLPAQQVLDPTLLLSRADYADLAEEDVTTNGPPYLLDFVLDPTPETDRLIEDLARARGLRRRTFMPPGVGSFRDFVIAPERYVRPSVASWLGAFRDADAVVTDSFHGTVFSIIFERPFLSVANRSRGVSRFESLLGSTGLRGRLLTLPLGDTEVPVLDDIQWSEVRSRLQALRDSSRQFITSHLGTAG